MATQKQLREKLAKAQKGRLTALECLAHFAGNFSKAYEKVAEAVADEKVSTEEYDHLPEVPGQALGRVLGEIHGARNGGRLGVFCIGHGYRPYLTFLPWRGPCKL